MSERVAGAGEPQGGVETARRNEILIQVAFYGPHCANDAPGRPGYEPGCQRPLGWVALGPRGGKRDAARVLREQGWRFSGGRWFCPRCAGRWR